MHYPTTPPDGNAFAEKNPLNYGQRRRFETLKAAAEAHGITVSRATAKGQETFLVSRWYLTKAVHTLRELEQFLATQGVRP